MMDEIHKNPAPELENTETEIVPLVIQDLNSRYEFGLKKYGVSLRINNNRNALQDAYEEILDLALYLRQELEEQKQRKVTESIYFELGQDFLRILALLGILAIVVFAIFGKLP